MKYLFFDTECCDGIHICEFGYVLTDESFRILEKDVFAMAPEMPFALPYRSGKPYLKLYFTKKQYESSPAFPAFYDRIKRLITADGTIVVGHSASNDAMFLRTACERYGKEYADFGFADTQRLFAAVCGSEGGLSLEHAAQTLGLDLSERLHKSDDDALVTMRVMRALSERTGLSPAELLSLYPAAHGISRNGCVWYAGESFPEQLAQVWADPASASRNRKSRCINKYAALLSVFSAVSGAPLCGKSLCLGAEYEITHTRETISVITLLSAAGGTYSARVAENDYYVNTDGAIKNRRDYRMKAALKARNEHGSPEIITVDGLYSLLGTDENGLSSMPPPEIDIREWTAREKLLRKKSQAEGGSVTSGKAHIEKSASLSLGQLLKDKGVGLVD